MRSIADLAADLSSGRTRSRALIEEALARIDAPGGEGKATFVKVHRVQALAAAEASDRLRAQAIVPSPLAGLPVSIKDLFDIAGDVTTAGSVALADAPPARADAPAVRRLRAAGAVIVGRSNMTEFAYSGVGLNPHYGTPRNAWDRATGRIPGGSSSGAAVSVTDRMAVAGLGTDTGGSIRIPSALCGITGLKPTARRVPREGGVPLSTTLDSFGPLAPGVACCALVDAVLAGEAPVVPDALPLHGLRLAVCRTIVLDDLDRTVSTTFEATLQALAKAGASVKEVAFPVLTSVRECYAAGGFTAPESFAWHRKLMERAGDKYDPRVIARIRRGGDVPAADYVDLLWRREALCAEADAATAPYDAVLLPTCPTVAPPIDALSRVDDYSRINLLMLRNSTFGNFLDRPALSIPCHKPGEPPVGLMVMGPTMGDRRLVSVGLAVEAALAAAGRGVLPAMAG
ncbi:MAG: amidase [Alphaproteobacteria bacterium]|nr:amidase [Alphaproteobacteria bacterium]